MSKESRIFIWSITVALGGFLFGFDTAVISGAEQSIQQVWSLSDVAHGLAVAIALYGTVLGAMFGGIPADKIGRKKTLFWVAAIYLVSALGSALAPDQYTFMFFRVIGGIGVGASSVVAPMYISEIASSKNRGKLVALFQFNIVLGIVIAYISNYLLEGISENSWRWMLGVEAFPALVFLISIRFVPLSPRWLLVKKHDEQAARVVLHKIDPEVVEESIKSINESASKKSDDAFKLVMTGKYNLPMLLTFFVAFFNQMSGINAIIYYAPRILQMTGAGISSALLSTVGIGLVNLIFTIVGMILIDRSGRKMLMYIGSVGLISALGLVSYSFYNEVFNLVPLYLLGFIGFFAMSQGAAIWVFISEVFPNDVRAFGQSLGAFTHWFMAAIVANVFPFFVNTFEGGPIFLFFSLMMFLQLLFVAFLMPETKGFSLEELGKRFMKG